MAGLLDSGGPSGSTRASFMLSGSPSFQPLFVPERMEEVKERNLDRQENWCGGEDVTDFGAKNREFHISGRLLESEIGTFDAVLDAGTAFDMVSVLWTGEVYVVRGTLEGPLWYDPRLKDFIYTYSIDVLSSGRDEPLSDAGSGIISDGAISDTTTTTIFGGGVGFTSG